ncbi:exosome complex exonuclease RRP42 [Trichogramma pretiosum]|uniref:exosome complex exonuclease RRP42 n=1 Tax=Trichogramma pretiosum TaxID=7493 RepID=UPI0006C9B517|nr:exosome complex exonuclease RRP42 [Trichogramma pretiosum]
MSELVSLSLPEKTFILHGIDVNFRNDGRSRLDCRPIELQTKIMDQVNGSAKLKIDDTEILVGVKVEEDTPDENTPSEGKLEFFVDCSANANPIFEGKGGDELAKEISDALALAYKDVFDLTELCILPSKKCWKLYVDVLILACGGNLFDAVAAAVKAALYSTEIPQVKDAAVDGVEADIFVSDDIFNSVKLDVKNAPLLISLCKIGDNYVVDPTPEEEVCSSATVVVAVMPNGRTSGGLKTGYGSLMVETWRKAIQIAKKVGVQLNNEIMKALEEEEKLGPNRALFGFL